MFHECYIEAIRWAEKANTGEEDAHDEEEHTGRKGGTVAMELQETTLLSIRTLSAPEVLIAFVLGSINQCNLLIIS